ncbi:MAG: RES family NAD+ phosphorylase [Gallionellaceae bacterium]
MTSLIDKYSDFVDEIKFRRRHFLSKNSQEFLSSLKEIADQRTFTLNQGDDLYRARKNAYKEHQPSFDARPSEEMKPIPNMKAEGRANPYNITMIYLASSEETAIAEVRPDLRFPVTIGQFKALKELKLVDLVSERPSFYGYFFPSEVNEDVKLWLSLSSDYSKQLFKEDQQINYLPTQVIAEYFKEQGFDGIVYQSQFMAQKRGAEKEYIAKNFVLFDPSVVECVKREVWKITEQSVFVEKHISR